METPTNANHLSEVSELLSIQSIESVNRFVREIYDTLINGGSLFVCGNGGSSAIAFHFVTDLVKIAIDTKISFPVFALGSNPALMTMISNDYGYEANFELELKAIGRQRDTLFAISSSGNSKNILNAVDFANEFGIKTIGLVGFDGGLLAPRCTSILQVETPIGCYARVEDVHSTICHDISIKLREIMEKL